MKQKILLALPLLALVACSNNPLGFSDDLAAIIKANVDEPQVTYEAAEVNTVSRPLWFDNFVKLNETSGLEVYQDGENYRFFSLLAKREIADNEDPDSYAVYPHSLCGFLLILSDVNGTVIYDGFGNELVRYSGQVNPSFETEDNQLRIFDQSNNEVEYTYTSSTPAKTYSGEAREDESQGGFSDGEIVGLPDYRIYNGEGLWMVADKDGGIVSSFRLPSFVLTADSTLIAGGVILAQRSYAVPEDEGDYTYYQNGVKYVLESYALNMLEGDYATIELPYLIGNQQMMLNDADGNPNLALANIQKINDHRALDPEESVILDKEGNIIDWGLGSSFFASFVEMAGGYYYSQANRTIFDDKLNPIAVLPVQASYLEKMDCFYYYTGSKITVYDHDGQRIYQDQAEQVYPSRTENSLMYTGEDGLLHGIQCINGEIKTKTRSGYKANSIVSYSFGIDGVLVIYESTAGPGAFGVYTGNDQKVEAQIAVSNPNPLSYTTFDTAVTYLDVGDYLVTANWPRTVNYDVK